MNRISIIARMTFREAVRRRIVLTGLVLGILFLIIFSIGFHMIDAAITENTSDRGGAMGRVIPICPSPFTTTWIIQSRSTPPASKPTS